MDVKLSAYKCTKCGKLHHPAHYICTQCGSRSFEEIPLEGAAKLVTFTKVYNLPEGYMRPWLGFCIAQFANGLCVSGQLDAEDATIGMPLRADIGMVKEGVGRDYYGFIFHKA